MRKPLEPKKIGLLGDMEVKNGSSCEKHQHDMPMPCPLGTVTRDARRDERRGRKGEGAAQK